MAGIGSSRPLNRKKAAIDKEQMDVLLYIKTALNPYADIYGMSKLIVV